MRWRRSPLLHFLAGGALLFALVHGRAPAPVPERSPDPGPLVVTADDVARLRTDYVRETGLEPTASDEIALVEKQIEEELLFREAVARGLDRHDRSIRTWLVEQMEVLHDGAGGTPDELYEKARALGLDRTDLVVRRILVQKMRLLAARADEREPDEAELRAFYEAHLDDYRPADRVAFWHVFLGASTRGDAALRDAEALLARARQGAWAPAEGVRHGDSFPVPSHLVGQSPAQLEKLFGPDFVRRLPDAPTGAWSGPWSSPYGAHLVWIESRQPGAPPAFEAVRGRVLERLLQERRSERLAELLRDLRARADLRVESDPWRQRNRS